MKKSFLLLPIFCATLTSCGAPSVQDFLDDPELLSKTTNTCLEQMFKKEKQIDEKTCQNAKEAQVQKTKNALNSIID